MILKEPHNLILGREAAGVGQRVSLGTQRVSEAAERVACGRDQCVWSVRAFKNRVEARDLSACSVASQCRINGRSGRGMECAVYAFSDTEGTGVHGNAGGHGGV